MEGRNKFGLIFFIELTKLIKYFFSSLPPEFIEKSLF